LGESGKKTEKFFMNFKATSMMKGSLPTEGRVLNLS
jgi:hypothetical protein